MRLQRREGSGSSGGHWLLPVGCTTAASFYSFAISVLYITEDHELILAKVAGLDDNV